MVGGNAHVHQQLKKTFIKKCMDHYNSRETRDQFFRMIQRESESLEYYEEIYQHSQKRTYICMIDQEYPKLVLLKGVSEELIKALNFLSNGEIFQLDYDDINKVFNKYSLSISLQNKDNRNYSPQYSKLSLQISQK